MSEKNTLSSAECPLWLRKFDEQLTLAVDTAIKNAEKRVARLSSLKLPVFEGNNLSWSDHYDRFWRIACERQWTEDEMLYHLVNSFHGYAYQYFSSLPNHITSDFTSLVKEMSFEYDIPDRLDGVSELFIEPTSKLRTEAIIQSTYTFSDSVKQLKQKLDSVIASYENSVPQSFNSTNNEIRCEAEETPVVRRVSNVSFL